MKDQSKTQEKIKRTYTKDMLIRRVANECNRSFGTVRDIYHTLEHDITEILASADKNTDVSIRLFEGITIDSKFVPEKTKINNLTGKEIISASKIKPKANITRNYCEKIDNYNK